jgi:uncharacterized membrane protein
LFAFSTSNTFQTPIFAELFCVLTLFFASNSRFETDTSYAYRSNNDGSLLVGYGNDAGGQMPVYWAGGAPIALGRLGVGNNIAWGVADDGSVIAGGSGANAFVWTPTDGMRNLHTYLTEVGASLSGFTSLTEVRGVSADGKTLAGYGVRNGNVEAFVAYSSTAWAAVPEPGSLALLSLAPVALAFRSRGRIRP